MIGVYDAVPGDTDRITNEKSFILAGCIIGEGNVNIENIDEGNAGRKKARSVPH